MSRYGKGFWPGPGEPDDAGESLEEHLRRISRRLRGSSSLRVERPRPLDAHELRRREAVRMRALSLLGTMRPELRDLDALSYGEALEKVCDAIVDLWICDECHEEAVRCTCLVEGDDWEDDDEGWSEDEDDDDGDGPDDGRPLSFLPLHGGFRAG